MRFTRHTKWQLAAALTALLILGLGAKPLLFHTAADKLPNRSVTLLDPTQSAITTYRFQFDITTSDSVGSIRFQFCSDTPLVDFPCTPPNGFDASAAVLQAQSGETGFSVSGATDANDIILTRTPTSTTPGTNTYDLSGITNPSATGSYYVRLQTYASTDASGSSIDDGGLAYVISSAVTISSEVPPYLLLCGGLTITGYDCSTASGDYINFGELSTTTTKTGAMQVVIATNAGSGYALWADGNTMESGTDVIPAISTTDVSRPGTSQFGINLRANATPPVGADVSGPGTGAVAVNYDVPDRFRFVSGDQLASAPGVNDFRKYTISYIVNIASDQPAGIYVSTVTLTCLANF